MSGERRAACGSRGSPEAEQKPRPYCRQCGCVLGECACGHCAVCPKPSAEDFVGRARVTSWLDGLNRSIDAACKRGIL
jgi:hypothetical protein